MGDSMPTGSHPAAAAPVPPPPHASLQRWTTYLLASQAAACRNLGSQLYATVLSAAADDVAASGPAWHVLEPHATRSSDAALGLRFMAALHRLVLTRQAPRLALHFPSVGGTAGPTGAWPAVYEVLGSHAEQLSQWVAQPCQTNEVGRCAALIGGFLTASADSRLPLRLLELGASAGLNLRWDRYHYRDVTDGRSWGDPSSAVALHGRWDVPARLLTADVGVVERQGCDPRPIDAASEQGRLALTASVWADQPHRFERLQGALRIAEQLPVDMAAERAADWLPAHLGPVGQAATVVYHSVVMQYLPEAERAEVAAVIAAAGKRATTAAPLYWLRMEPEQPLRAMAVRLTAWPGGHERLLASAGAHGDPVRWRD